MFDCQICNKSFNRQQELSRHNSSKKHIKLHSAYLLEKQEVETNLINEEPSNPKDWQSIKWKFTVLPTISATHNKEDEEHSEEEPEEEAEEESKEDEIISDSSE
jgi:hypothetical protein